MAVASNTLNYDQIQTPGRLLPYTCIMLDANFLHLFRACWKCLKIPSSQSEKLIAGIQQLFATSKIPGHYLPCLSVRSAFHLYLKASKFPRGSEILMSAITIPDMVHIAKSHGLCVIPVDIDPNSLEPNLNVIRKAITNRTVAIMAVHLYGKWHNVEDVLNLAKSHGLDFIEDAAQAFNGLDYLGHPESDLVFFSFGIIKRATCFGGAVARVKSEELFASMNDALKTFPTQTNSKYFIKLANCIFVHCIADFSSSVKLTQILSRLLRVDLFVMGISLLRNFGKNMLQDICNNPSPALLATMLERLSQEDFTKAREMRRIKAKFVRMLLPESVRILGSKNEDCDFWLFPILVNHPNEMVKLLNKFGVKAYRGVSQLNCIEPENLNNNEVSIYPTEARSIIDHLVYIPVHANMSYEELVYLCQTVECAVKFIVSSRL